MVDVSARLTADWFDTTVYRGCVALSIVLPDYAPLHSVVPIRIVEDFFESSGTGRVNIDDRWMSCPYTVLTKWIHVPWPIHPWIEDFSIATDALAKAGIGNRETSEGKAMPDALSGQLRSVVMVVLPVKAIEPALELSGEKVNVITLVHWILTEWMRAVRMATTAALPDLTARRMPVAVPVRYAEVRDGELHWTDTAYDLFTDDLVERTLPQPIVPREVVDRVGQAFGALTWGRPSAIILNHIVRGESAARVGDDVGALLAYATACEVAIVNLSLALRWEHGHDAVDVARDLREVSASKMVTSLCHWLGAGWSLDSPGPARSWFVDIAQVRNRIIHAGHRPTHEQLRAAHDTVGEFMTHIAKRLVVKWKECPKTLALFVSRASVDRYASKKSHARVVETIESLAEASEDAFAEWRRTYQSAS